MAGQPDEAVCATERQAVENKHEQEEGDNGRTYGVYILNN